MHKLGILILTSIVLLSSCSIDWNDEKEKKIGELEAQIAIPKLQLAQKKKECESLKGDIAQKASANISTRSVQSTTTLEEVFYSTYLNDCVYVTNEFSQKTHTHKTAFLLASTFGQSSSILRCETNPNYFMGCTEFEFWIKKLKGE